MLFLCLVVIYLYLNEFTLAFTPNNKVWGHSAVFAYPKIYIIGGIIPDNPNSFSGTLTYSKEFYCLDVGKSFGVGAGDKLPWVDLSFVSQIPPEHAWSAFSNCGHDDSLILYPGEYRSVSNVAAQTVYTFNLSLQQWNKNNMTTNPPLDNYHSQSQTVCDARTGKIYRFGGNNNFNLPDTGRKINQFMDILDISTLVWTNSSNTVNAPRPRFDHSGTLLPNGNIVYIGGCLDTDGKSYVEMSELFLYNTNNDTWTLMIATGDLPTRRTSHSAVLTQDGRIIVYGGRSENGLPVNDDLVILDTTQPNYTWSKANVSTNSPPSRYYHTATLVDYYMIVTFGRTDNDFPPPTSNEVFILNTHDKYNYKWVNEFDPDPTLYKNLNKNLNTQIRYLTIGIIILSSLLTLMGASFLICFYRKRRVFKPDLIVPSSQETN